MRQRPSEAEASLVGSAHSVLFLTSAAPSRAWLLIGGREGEGGCHMNMLTKQCSVPFFPPSFFFFFFEAQSISWDTITEISSVGLRAERCSAFANPANHSLRCTPHDGRAGRDEMPNGLR